MLPSSFSIQVNPEADVYELDAEDSDNSDPEARTRRVRNLEGRAEDAGWLTWLDGERPKGTQAHHSKPKLVEPASKRVRVVVSADALKGTPPVTPPRVRQVIAVPKNKPKGSSVAAGPRVPLSEPQLSTATDPVFVPSGLHCLRRRTLPSRPLHPSHPRSPSHLLSKHRSPTAHRPLQCPLSLHQLLHRPQGRRQRRALFVLDHFPLRLSHRPPRLDSCRPRR